MSVVLILLSCGLSIFSGILLDRSSPGGTANYRAVYYGARCVIAHRDPYNPQDFVCVYNAESGQFPTQPLKKQLFLRALTVCVNLPTTLLLVSPLAMLAWDPSHVIWLLLVACSLTAAAFFAYDLARPYAPRLALLLVCIMMANSEVLYATGNTAGIAVGLCVAAVWCVVKQRAVGIGVVCLAISLALKPHDSGLIWLYLVLAGGSLRKRGLQALALTAVVAIAAVWWVSTSAPDWSRELHANLANTSARGDISDPGPTSASRKGSADVIIDLQTVVSVFRDVPALYNPIVYAVCGLLLVLWGFRSVRADASTENHWLGLAMAAPLTMLFSYHRPYDAKLLLLAIPACSMLWAEAGKAGRIALALNAAAVVISGDIPLAVMTLATARLNLNLMSGAEKILLMPLLRPVPLALFALTLFNLLIWMRRARDGQKTSVLPGTKAENALP